MQMKTGWIAYSISSKKCFTCAGNSWLFRVTPSNLSNAMGLQKWLPSHGEGATAGSNPLDLMPQDSKVMPKNILRTLAKKLHWQVKHQALLTTFGRWTSAFGVYQLGIATFANTLDRRSTNQFPKIQGAIPTAYFCGLELFREFGFAFDLLERNSSFLDRQILHIPPEWERHEITYKYNSNNFLGGGGGGGGGRVSFFFLHANPLEQLLMQMPKSRCRRKSGTINMTSGG